MAISYGKVLIYVLTFLGYAYSGYGSDLLSTLRDAVISAQNIFENVITNTVHVVKKIKSLNEFLDATVDEHCDFKCPSGAKPTKNKYHTPQSNGCGSLGLQIDKDYLPVAEMSKCCDSHDVCYGTCNSNKEVCDVEFKRCLYQYCDKYKESLGQTVTTACKGAAKLLFTGTLALGCKPYLDAQTQACYCPKKPFYDKEL